MKCSFFIFFISLQMLSCDNFNTKLHILNNRQTDISYYISDSNQDRALQYYSSRYFYSPDGIKRQNLFDRINANTNSPIPIIGDWETHIKDDFKNGTMYVYVINFEDIGKSYSYLRINHCIVTYKVTNKSIENSNWILNIKSLQ